MVRELKTLAADDEARLKQQAALWINAIDPCVAENTLRAPVVMLSAHESLEVPRA